VCAFLGFGDDEKVGRRGERLREREIVDKTEIINTQNTDTNNALFFLVVVIL
jgi:hypothetical protein